MARGSHGGANLAAVGYRSAPAIAATGWSARSLLGRLQREEAVAGALLGLALALGLLVRAVPLLTADGFPLNDGGMFYAMVEDVKAAGYALPETISYNGGEAAFAYPPLPFYTAAALSDLGGWSTLDLLRFLPLLFSVLTIGAFFLLARTVLASSPLAGLATLVFATIPRAFNWEIVGGGLTRSPGLFFALLAIWQGYQLFTGGRRRHLLAAAALSALTILCHPEMGLFVAFTLGLFLTYRGVSRDKLVNGAALAALVAALTTPWWLEALIRVGPEPLLAAAQTGSHSLTAPLKFLSLSFSEEPFFPVAMVLGLLGLAERLRSGEALLPLWLAAVFVLEPRIAPSLATVPLALLAAYGLSQVVWPLVRPVGAAPGRRLVPRATLAYVVIGAVLVVYAPLTTVIAAQASSSPLHVLSAGEREAMAWTSANTPDSARFLVMPSTLQWWLDISQEWFPTLSGRVSVATVQGSEWLPGGVYASRSSSREELIECSSSGTGCVEAWARQWDVGLDYVYLPKGKADIDPFTGAGERRDCCVPLRASLASSPGYELVYDSASAAIYRRR